MRKSASESRTTTKIPKILLMRVNSPPPTSPQPSNKDNVQLNIDTTHLDDSSSILTHSNTTRGLTRSRFNTLNSTKNRSNTQESMILMNKYGSLIEDYENKYNNLFIKAKANKIRNERNQLNQFITSNKYIHKLQPMDTKNLRQKMYNPIERCFDHVWFQLSEYLFKTKDEAGSELTLKPKEEQTKKCQFTNLNSKHMLQFDDSVQAWNNFPAINFQEIMANEKFRRYQKKRTNVYKIKYTESDKDRVIFLDHEERKDLEAIQIKGKPSAYKQQLLGDLGLIKTPEVGEKGPICAHQEVLDMIANFEKVKLNTPKIIGGNKNKYKMYKQFKKESPKASGVNNAIKLYKLSEQIRRKASIVNSPRSRRNLSTGPSILITQSNMGTKSPLSPKAESPRFTSATSLNMLHSHRASLMLGNVNVQDIPQLLIQQNLTPRQPPLAFPSPISPKGKFIRKIKAPSARISTNSVLSDNFSKRAKEI